MSSRRFVVNASPLIYLPQVDCLHLLKELAAEILVPETKCGQAGTASSRVPTSKPSNGSRSSPTSSYHPRSRDLGAGESQALAHTASSPEGS